MRAIDWASGLGHVTNRYSIFAFSILFFFKVQDALAQTTAIAEVCNTPLPSYCILLQLHATTLSPQYFFAIIVFSVALFHATALMSGHLSLSKKFGMRHSNLSFFLIFFNFFRHHFCKPVFSFDCWDIGQVKCICRRAMPKSCHSKWFFFLDCFRILLI